MARGREAKSTRAGVYSLLWDFSRGRMLAEALLRPPSLKRKFGPNGKGYCSQMKCISPAQILPPNSDL